MGIEEIGQVCVMIHCGSRGLGHQVATGLSAKFLFLVVFSYGMGVLVDLLP